MARKSARLFLLLNVAWLVSSASAQPEQAPAANPPNGTNLEPNTSPPPTPQRNLFQFDELHFDLLFEGRYDSRRVEYDADGFRRRAFRQTNTSWLFEESVGMETTGAIGGSDLILFDVAARWGLSQERFSENVNGLTRHEDPHGTLLEYDLNFTLFPRGRISANVFAERVDSRLPRAFLPSLDRSYERYGFDLTYNDQTFPMRLTYEHVYDALTSRSRFLEDDELRAEDRLRWEGTWQINEFHALRLDYEYSDRKEEYSGGDTVFDTRRHYVTATHSYRFGKEKRSLWEMLGRFQAESGDLGRDIAELSARLRLQHTDQFATNYALQFLRENYFDVASSTYRAEAGLTYDFTESLRGSAQIYGLQQNADRFADQRELGGIASLNYTRPNAWGRFSAYASYDHASIRTDNGRQSGVVLGESATFRDPLPVILAQQDIQIFTIVVTDRTRTRTYLAGRDYLVTRLGRYVSLTRLISGRITNNETVLVSYVYRVYDNYDLDRDRFDWRLQQDFDNGFTTYYAGSLQDERLDTPQFLRYRARNINRHRLGVSYRQNRWSAGAEYEFNDDAIDPYQAVHFNGDVVLYRDVRQSLNGRGNFSYFWFDGSAGLESRDSALVDLGADYRYLIARNLEATAAALYRFESDSLFGNTNGVDLTAGLEWQVGFFKLGLEAEYDLLDLASSREDTFAVWLRLRREIPFISRRGL